jgi:serine/threonine-protein kinase
MPFHVPIEEAAQAYPEYEFVRALTPSVQKAAFHVRDASGHDLCLKIISPEYELDRLRREIGALQSITHPNVVRLVEYTFSSKPGSLRHFIIEEFIQGTDLSERLIEGQQWVPREAARFFGALLEGLSALDKKNIVHRDLKPSNIRVRTSGVPVIIDFGVARHLDQPDLTHTSQGAAIGTPPYFAPEQFYGTKHDIDPRTDLFAAGILLHQALVGRHPFWRMGMTRQELSEAVTSSEAYQLSEEFLGLPSTWRLLVTRLLAKSRASRPRHAVDVVAIFRRLETV